MIIRCNVFSPALTEALRALLLRRELFGPATVTGDALWRSGMVAHVEHLPEGRAAAEEIIKYFASTWIFYELKIPYFFPTRCEVQLSSYGDGDYFRTHTDNGTPDAAARRISWVAYLDAVPGLRPWFGGELVAETGRETVAVTPADGETVFFPSAWLHEVRPVAAPPGWTSRRFSVNGWIS